jgi:HemY protein
MMRLLFILVAAGVIALGAAWLADHDGVLTLIIAGYELRTSAGFAALLVLVLAALLFALTRVVFLILGGPAKLGAFFAGRRTRKGQEALVRGLLATAAADTVAARDAAGSAETLLGAQPLVLLLKAETAQLSGDEDQEDAAYRAMLGRAETEFLGARGLFALAMRRNDTDQAIGFALRAHALRPGSVEAANALFELRLARREWADAEALLTEMTEAKLLTPESAQRRRDALLADQANDRAAASEAPVPLLTQPTALTAGAPVQNA